MNYIEVPSADSYRIYVPELGVANRLLDAAALWQDRELKYQGEVWLGYEILPGTKEPILELMRKLFGAEDVTEDFFNSLDYQLGPR